MLAKYLILALNLMILWVVLTIFFGTPFWIGYAISQGAFIVGILFIAFTQPPVTAS